MRATAITSERSRDGSAASTAAVMSVPRGSPRLDAAGGGGVDGIGMPSMSEA